MILPVLSSGLRAIFAESESAIFRPFRASHLAVGCEIPCDHSVNFGLESSQTGIHNQILVCPLRAEISVAKYKAVVLLLIRAVDGILCW